MYYELRWCIKCLLNNNEFTDIKKITFNTSNFYFGYTVCIDDEEYGFEMTNYLVEVVK